MNQSKLVSVCINAYNSEKYIAELLNSVCSQTYQNLQIIVIDDASTDNTSGVVRDFDDPRIELYTLEKNGHISNANNEAYRKVRGEYMVHIDSDDVVLPDLIEKSIDYLEQHHECGATFCRLSTIDENSNPVPNEYIENVFKVTAKTQAEFVRLFFDSLNHLSHTGVTMRKSVIDDIGFHDLSLCYLHDFDYWTRLVLKYPIYVFDECLAKYRMNTSGEHNSYLNESKMIAHNTEFSRIIYRMIDNCPDSLFLEAFSDKLRLSGPHTHDEIKLEKAFLLQEGLSTICLPENKFLSIVMLANLFADKKYVDLARDKFGFTIRDFYKLQTTPVFYDKTKTDEKNSEISSLLSNVTGLNSHITDLHSVIDKNENDIAYYIDLAKHKQKEIDIKNLIIEHKQSEIKAKDSIIEHKQGEINTKELIIEQKQAEIDAKNSIIEHKQKLLNRTVEYRVAKFFSKIFNVLKHAKHLCCLRDKSGKKYRKCVMIYGYYAINLGDDMFLEKLITRYPDTMFFVYSVYFCKEYRAFFERFDNVKFFATEDALVQKINRLGEKFKISDLVEMLLLKRSNATVHVGGSIYQQVGDYEFDYKIRKRRKQRFKPFYSISSNFGAYKTQEFKAMWQKQFVRFKDICFRDKYSYNQFSNLKCVRYAPDLLFSYKGENAAEVKGKVAISVFDPQMSNRNLSKEVCDSYKFALQKTVCDLVSSGKTVTLLAFCSFEGDTAFIENLLAQLEYGVKSKVEVINYSFDTKNAVLDALSSAEYIIGTRLHSVILGLTMGKKVLPIAYNQKTHNILDDLGYDQPVIDLSGITEYQQSGFVGLLDSIKPFDVSGCKSSDEQQFEKLDKFLK